MDEVYHVFTRSIAHFKIFNNGNEFLRMKEALDFYRAQPQSASFSGLKKISNERANAIRNKASSQPNDNLVEIIAYCIMPTHVHLILRQLRDGGISRFMSNVLNSYSRYFNLKHNRKGPLWEGRYKKVLVESDEQLLHLTRYIHLNPTTASLVERPEQWPASSYREYILPIGVENKLCMYNHVIDVKPDKYKQFVEDRKFYQRELAKIKHLVFDEDGN